MHLTEFSQERGAADAHFERRCFAPIRCRAGQGSDARRGLVAYYYVANDI